MNCRILKIARVRMVPRNEQVVERLLVCSYNWNDFLLDVTMDAEFMKESVLYFTVENKSNA